MIKNYSQYINEDLLGKNIRIPEIEYDNLILVYPSVQLKYNDDFKIVISSDDELKLNNEFYETLEKDGINKDDIVFENCEKISLYSVSMFTKIFDYGTFGSGIKDFSGSYCRNLQSLQGSPKEVTGDFDCSFCKNLTSLEGSPEIIGGYFSCSRCSNLLSLKFAPKEVGGDFWCHYCTNLINLDGAPNKVGDFYCYGCNPDFIEQAKQKYGDKVKS